MNRFFEIFFFQSLQLSIFGCRNDAGDRFAVFIDSDGTALGFDEGLSRFAFGVASV